jgi:nucleotide-binding universal stress UspA family protein
MPGLNALIPLDGTKLAESAFELLPFIKTLGFDRLTLVSVWDSGLEERVREDMQERHELMTEVEEKGRAFLDTYLGQQAAQLRADGYAVDVVVRMGRAADEVLAAAEELAPDLVLIATHGRDGLERWRLGSIADKVVRGAPCPTLVIGPNVETDIANYDLTKVLVPVDGGELAEAALPIASWIASAHEASIDLVRVISLTSVAYDPSMGMYPVDLVTAIEDAARAYLDRIGAGLAAKHQVETTLLMGSAGEQILEYLKEHPAGLVVLASHGRAGVVRAALGSVADRMLHGPAPVLILRPEEETKSRLVEQAEAAAG